MSPIARARLGRVDPQHDHAGAVVGLGRERHVGDVDPGAAERERDLARRRPAGWARRAQICCTAPASAPARPTSQQRAGAAGRRPPARPRGRRVAGVEQRAHLPQPPHEIVDLRAERVAVGAVDLRPQRRVGARRPAWRRESSGPVAGSVSPPSASAACATSRLATTCGRCETAAMSRSWSAGAIAVGTRAEAGDEAREALVEDAGGRRGAASGTRWRRRRGPRGRARRRSPRRPPAGGRR